MKREISLTLIISIGLLIFIPYAYGDIDGWWKVKINRQEGDFVTGEWQVDVLAGKSASYIYISGAQENAYNSYGGAWLYLVNLGSYIEEYYSTIYMKNGIIVLFDPTGLYADGNFAGTTIVLRAYGPPGNPTQLKGYYTLFDMETSVTPDLFVRMGPVTMNKIQAKDVPDVVKQMQVTE